MTAPLTTDRAATVRRATSADVPLLADVLAAAFHDDPVMRWAVPDDDRRRQVFPPLFAVYAAGLVGFHETYLDVDGRAVALWWPGPPPPDVGEELGGAVVDVLGDGADRTLALMESLDAHEPSTPHLHLQLLGTVPAWQGHGLGSALLRPVLDRLDREQVPAYLEATSPSSRRLYERHGFVAATAIGPEGCPPVWPMWRAPQG